jgi:hypothetical protein
MLRRLALIGCVLGGCRSPAPVAPAALDAGVTLDAGARLTMAAVDAGLANRCNSFTWSDSHHDLHAVDAAGKRVEGDEMPACLNWFRAQTPHPGYTVVVEVDRKGHETTRTIQVKEPEIDDYIFRLRDGHPTWIPIVREVQSLPLVHRFGLDGTEDIGHLCELYHPEKPSPPRPVEVITPYRPPSAERRR